MAATLVLAMAVALPARAAGLIRDSDIEHALDKVAAPILSAAGLRGQVRILLVNDPSLNAFVVDAQHIFIHTGMLYAMKTPEMLQSVIAHEAAHITNGHLTRRMANLGTARSAAGLGLALAVAAAAISGNADLASGIALGTQSSATRRFLAHTRAEESAADRSGARYMASAGIDLNAAVEVHEVFRGQEALNVSRQDPYMRSHPLTIDRMRSMKALADSYKGTSRPQPEVDYWYDRAVGKVTAFTRSSKWTLRRAPESSTEDIRLMREAIAYHRLPDKGKALSRMNQLVALKPDDAFYHDLHGQILLEQREFKAAVEAYARASELAPSDALILAGYGRALLSVGRHKEALEVLEKSRSRDFRNARMLRDLAQAYAENGNNGMASLATAERYALQGRLKDAKIHAQRASGLLPQGSSGWRRAEDVVAAAKRAERK